MVVNGVVDCCWASKKRRFLGSRVSSASLPTILSAPSRAVEFDALPCLLDDETLLRLEGDTTFRQNYGNYGGAIFNSAVSSSSVWDAEDGEEYQMPTIDYPADTVFEDNYGEV